MAPNKKYKGTSHKSRKTLWLAIGIIVIVIIAAGTYVVIGRLGNSLNSSPTPTPTPNTSPTPSVTSSTTSTPTQALPQDNGVYSSTSTKVLLHTTAGDITIELRDDKPITTANFINIVKKGWYDGTIFHRVIAGFMIQGGAITQTVPPIQDEIGTNNSNVAYTIAMAKTSSPNSATSEFFINVANNGNNPIDAQGTKFDAVYTEFGRVIAGQNVVDAIANAPVTTNQNTGEDSQPVNPVTLISATVVS
jgi:cyclophilin family peptidyl-prolyl cis-trans isomerase